MVTWEQPFSIVVVDNYSVVVEAIPDNQTTALNTSIVIINQTAELLTASECH